MKNAFVLAVFTLVAAIAVDAMATNVRGHMRQDGTYVQPYQRTNPDGNQFNNYSTKGNYNPNTGREGTVDPWK